MSAEPTARCYAVRRVNPFEGVLQVVETHNARAYSPNGQIWQVQVLTRRPDHTWRSFSDITPIEQFFNFGLWDPAGGLQKIPANPLMDIGGMSDAANALTGTLHGLLDRLQSPEHERVIVMEQLFDREPQPRTEGYTSEQRRQITRRTFRNCAKVVTRMR